MPNPSAPTLRERLLDLDRLEDLGKKATRDPNDRCQDFDDDCFDVRCKLTCWLYDPEKGLCPFLTGEIS